MSPAQRLGILLLQAVQVAFILLHDWIPLGRLSNRSAVQTIDSKAKLFWTTVLSALPFALVFAVSCIYWRAPHWPMWLETWLFYTYAIAAGGAFLAWWGPYLFWHSPERVQRYRVRFAGTTKFLPERHGFAPDTLHVLYHACIVATLVLVIRL